MPKKDENQNRVTQRDLDEIVMEIKDDTEDDEGIYDRRQSPRLAISGLVICVPMGKAREIRGEIIDLSMGGLYFKSPRKIKLNDLVQVTFHADDSGNPSEAIAQVIRVIPIDKGFEVAVKFLTEE